MSLSLVDVSIFLSCIARPCLVSLAIAGLSMAIGLALTGHSVRVLEKSPSLGSPPGGLRLTPNVTKILVQWGLEDELSKKGTLVREGTRFWNCKLFDRCSLS
jgi:salicylate hydroxylase